tara:strand:- start:1501 stop:1932 length:432 start_codon:yes stop_codon:yes gene_type:complete
MFFRHNADNTIEINGAIFELDLFLEVEPDYILPDGIVAQEYIPNKHHRYYDGISQIGADIPWVDGDRYIQRLADLKLMSQTNEEDKRYVDSFPQNQPEPDTNRNNYTMNEIIMTIWDHLFEGIDNTDKAKELSDKIKNYGDPK